MIVGFYKMMQSGGAGDKVSKIELVDLTPDDVKKATAPQDSPTGGKVCLNLKPTKKLVIVIEKKDENGSSTNTTENFIAAAFARVPAKARRADFPQFQSRSCSISSRVFVTR